MKVHNQSWITFAFLMALLSASIHSEPATAEVALRGQRVAGDITYGQWKKLCFRAAGAPMLCRTSISGTYETGQMAVRIDLIERENGGTPRVQLFVPVGMYLRIPAKLKVDKGEPYAISYSWCLSNSCIAADVAAPKLVRAMESGTTLALELVDSNLLSLTASVPLSQFRNVRQGPPAQMLEQDIEE